MQHITFHGSDNKIAICTRSTADEEADEEKDEDEDEDTDGAGVRLQIQGGIDDDEEQHRPRADSASQQHRILQPQTLQETANLAVFVSTVATAAVSTASAAAAAATTSAQEASGIPALSTSRNINPILNNIPASSAPPQPLRQSTSSSTATVAATAAAASSSSLQKRSRSDFKFGETLGEGSYSSVIVATESSTGRRFAVKILSKAHIIKEKKIKYVQIEKDVLNRLSHPFIIKLYYTFQDSHSLYFVLEYARKGDLLALIRKLPRYQMDAACWYTAELITAVEYLHR